MFTVEPSDVVKRARRLYAQMGPTHLKEAVEQARAEAPSWHKHQSRGLTTITHSVRITPRCPVTGVLLEPGLSKRVVVYTQRGRFPHSTDYQRLSLPVVGL